MSTHMFGYQDSANGYIDLEAASMRLSLTTLPDLTLVRLYAQITWSPGVTTTEEITTTGTWNWPNAVGVTLRISPRYNDDFGAGTLVGTILSYRDDGTRLGQVNVNAVILARDNINFPPDQVGDAGADVLVGDSLANDLLGRGGDDVLAGRGGADRLDGGSGLDTADYSLSSAGVTVRLGGSAAGGDAQGDVLVSIENLTGSASTDILVGDAGANVLRGGDGDDQLAGRGGADVLDGGAGDDTVDYSLAVSGVHVQLNTGVASTDGDGGTDVLSSVEHLIGSAFNDTLIGDAGANVLNGLTGADVLLGLGGNDVLWGGAGAANTLQGGLGDDVYIVEAADSVIEGAGEGVDTVYARVNAHALAAHVEILIFDGVGAFAGTGNAGDNTLTGGAGNDNLRGRGGVDVLNGGGGVDTVDYTLAAAGVTARLDLMRATNDGDGATDTFTGIENLTGSTFNDLLIGDGGNNVLMGGIGTDTLLGYGGNDVLMGGSGGGNNQLQGGTGDDWYILDAFDTVVELFGEGVDTVEARVGSYTLAAHVENLLYTGPGGFVGTGNTLNNQITGGAQNDILRGRGGDDFIDGGLGVDEVQFRGAAADYVVSAEGLGWRIVDSAAGRDGSTYVESVETLRFADNVVRALTYPPAAPPEPPAKALADLLPPVVDIGSGDLWCWA